MKKKRLLFFMIAVWFGVIQPLTAQVRFSSPIYAQNTFVYDSPQWFGYHIFSFQKFRSQYVPADTFYLVQTLISSSYFYWITKTTNDLVVLGNSNSDWEEFYPSSPPILDSLYLRRMSYQRLDSSICYILRRFDTTLFSIPVKAFTCFIPDRREVTVADSFGMIRYVEIRNTFRDTANLQSCTINGANYNWETQDYHWMNLCLGNVYQFKYSLDKLRTYVISQDTIINSKRCYFHPREGWLCDDQKGLYRIQSNGKEEIFIPSNATVGTVIQYISGYWFVVSARVHYYLGRERKILHFQRIARIDENETDMSWIEGIGMTDFGWAGRPDGENLVYFKSCGEEWGTFVGVEHNYEALNNFELLQNSPNPFATTTTISYQIISAAHVLLEVFDILGRKVATLVDEEKDAGEYTSKFDIRHSLFDIHPGIYFYRLTVGKNVLTRKMIVMK